jgi:hypothetical protein
MIPGFQAITAMKRSIPGLIGGLLLFGAPALAAAKPASLTGCIDEQPGPRYVLRGDQQLRLIARLEPDGFSVQSFAKYLGHKVVVTGQLNTEGEPPLMMVKSIKRVAAFCAPEEPGTAQAPAAPARLSGERTQTGCVDEQPGPRYVLRGHQELKLLLELEPESFPVESFARYLGHKVQVRGHTYTVDGRTILRVHEIERLSHSCAPRAAQGEGTPRRQ